MSTANRSGATPEGRAPDGERTGRTRANAQGSPDLASLCGDLLLIGQRIADADLPDAPTFKKRLMAEFEAVEARARDHGLTQMDADDVRFALAALIDERIQYSPWAERLEWRARPLQADLFGETLAGERFFERLARARERKSKTSVQVFLLTLLLGFRGKYRGREAELARIVADARFFASQDRTALSPRPIEATEKQIERRSFSWRVGAIAIAGATILLLSGLYLALHLHAETVSAMLRTLSAL